MQNLPDDILSSLTTLHHGVNLRSKFNFKVKYDFSTNKGRNNCNTYTSFLCNFDCKIHLARNKCNTSFSRDFGCKIHFWIKFGDLTPSSRSEGQFQGQIYFSIICDPPCDKVHPRSFVTSIYDVI